MKLAEVKIEGFISMEGSHALSETDNQGATATATETEPDTLQELLWSGKTACIKTVHHISGMIDTTVMIMTGIDLGRCHVYDTSRIVLWDAEQHVGCVSSVMREKFNLQKTRYSGKKYMLMMYIGPYLIFNALVQDILDNNPWGYTTYVSAGVRMPAVARGTESYTGSSMRMPRQRRLEEFQ